MEKEETVEPPQIEEEKDPQLELQNQRQNLVLYTRYKTKLIRLIPSKVIANCFDLDYVRLMLESICDRALEDPSIEELEKELNEIDTWIGTRAEANQVDFERKAEKNAEKWRGIQAIERKRRANLRRLKQGKQD